MRDARTSILVFGFYLLGLGVLLVFVPNLVLGSFGIPPTSEVWIRIDGMLLGMLGTLYLAAAREGVTAFFRWTVFARPIVLPFLTGLVVLGMATPTVALFGVIELLGAAWTGFALRAPRTVP